jgi:hypothetical protein
MPIAAHPKRQEKVSENRFQRKDVGENGKERMCQDNQVMKLDKGLE